MPLQSLSNHPRQIVRPVMPAQKRHDGRAILGNSNHRRLRHLVREQRCNKPDHRAGCHYGNDRAAGRKQRLNLRPRLVEQPVGRGDTHPRPGKLTPDGVRDGAASRSGLFAQDDDGGSGHAEWSFVRMGRREIQSSCPL